MYVEEGYKRCQACHQHVSPQDGDGDNDADLAGEEPGVGMCGTRRLTYLGCDLTNDIYGVGLVGGLGGWAGGLSGVSGWWCVCVCGWWVGGGEWGVPGGRGGNKQELSEKLGVEVVGR